MAISTGTQLKMVQVSTQAKYNDIASKDPGTLYWVVETKKVYLDGVAYGFNQSDITGGMLYDIIKTPNPTANAVTVNVEDDVNGDLIIKADVRLWEDGDNLLHKDPSTGEIYVDSAIVGDIAHDIIIARVLDKLGQTNGIASLDAAGKVPSDQLPSFVDDVLEFTTKSAFPAVGEAGKIYVALNDNKTYRWGGSAYVEISSSLALGTTSSTAFRGDYGNTAYQHVSKTDNPHGVTKSQVGLGSVQNYGLASKAQAEAGTVDTAYMTPLRTKEAINKLAPKVTWTVIS